jgi:hypothetical protein
MVVEDVECIAIDNGISKRNARVGGVEPLEKRFFFATSE